MSHEGSNTSAICLCILFNHPFTANIPLLRRLYAGRFSHIRFLVPFAETGEEDVLTVYRGSFAHHSFVADHAADLDALSCSHYLLIHDDVLLSPWVNEHNILDLLGITSNDEGFMGVIGPPPVNVGDWGFQLGSLWKLLHSRNYLSGTGVESLATILRHLPSLGEAACKAAAYGIPASTRFVYTADTLAANRTLGTFRYMGGDGEDEARFVELALRMLFGGDAPAELVIPYPIGYSGPHADLCVVPHTGFRRFCHIGAVLGAAGLFVEMASPTALMLSCATVRTRQNSKMNADWATSFIAPQNALGRLLHDERLLAIHPVKLSQITDIETFLEQANLSGQEIRKLDTMPYQTDVMTRWPDFDPGGYLAMNPDVLGSAYEHFALFGAREGRIWKR